MQEESDNASNGKESEKMMKRQATKKPSSLIESSSSSSVAGNYSAEPEELLFSDKSRLTSDLKKQVISFLINKGKTATIKSNRVQK